MYRHGSFYFTATTWLTCCSVSVWWLLFLWSTSPDTPKARYAPTYVDNVRLVQPITVQPCPFQFLFLQRQTLSVHVLLWVFSYASLPFLEKSIRYCIKENRGIKKRRLLRDQFTNNIHKLLGWIQSWTIGFMLLNFVLEQFFNDFIKIRYHQFVLRSTILFKLFFS